MRIPEPSPRDTMPLAKVPAEDVPAEDVSLEDILFDGGKHRRLDDELDTPPETTDRRRVPVIPVAAVAVALGLVVALVYGANHEVQGSGSADPASLPAQSATLPPPDPSTEASSTASAPPASAEVHAQSSVTTTAPPPTHKQSSGGGGNAPVTGKPTDPQAIEDSIASSIMSSIQSRFSHPPNHH